MTRPQPVLDGYGTIGAIEQDLQRRVGAPKWAVLRDVLDQLAHPS